MTVPELVKVMRESLKEEKSRQLRKGQPAWGIEAIMRAFHRTIAIWWNDGKES